MKVLIIDRDRLSSQMLTSKLQEQGHEVIVEPVKNAGLEHFKEHNFSAVFFDPSPQTDSRPFVLGIRRMLKQGEYPYIMLCSHNANKDECIKSGANDFLAKPIDVEVLRKRLANADRFAALTEYMKDLTEDYPSENGVIAKSAFNQLYLSAVDRADRYGEKTFLLFFAADNYLEISDAEGQAAADEAFQSLAKYIVRLRRQSDVLGQTGRNEYCLMLQRPIYETEPMEAANRFHDTLQMFEDIKSPAGKAVNVKLKLIALPTGEKMTEHLFEAGKKG